MNEGDIAAYVDAACTAQGLVLAAETRSRVIAQFTLIDGIAATVLEVDVDPDIEPANVFRP